MSFFGFGQPNVDKLKAKGDVQGLIKALSYRKNEAHYTNQGLFVDDTAKLRQAAAVALGQIRDPQAAGFLVEAALKDANPQIQQAAAQAVVNIGSPCIDPLAALLKDKKKSVRKRAAELMGYIKDTRAIEPLANLAFGEVEDDLYVREAAINAIVFIGNPVAIKHLLLGLNQSYLRVQELAIRALGQLRATQAIEALTEKLALSRDKDVQSELLNTLGIIDSNWRFSDGAQKAVPTCLAILKDTDDHKKRMAAINALREVGDSRAVEPLIKLVSDRNLAIVAEDALEKTIERHAVSIVLDDLKVIANLKNVIGYYSLTDDDMLQQITNGKEVDCSNLRALAQHELARRGVKV